MSEVSRQFRRWLLALDDADLGLLLAFSHELRWATFPTVAAGGDRRGRPSARELRAARTWLTGASNAHLTSLAFDAIEAAAEVLVGRHHEDQAMVANPDRGQLGRLLVTLGRPVGRFVLFSLLIGDATASPLAIRHRVELEDELIQAGQPTSVDDTDECEKGAASDSAPAIRLLRAVESDEVFGIDADVVELHRCSAELTTQLTLALARVAAGGTTGPLATELAGYDGLRGRVVGALGDLCGLDDQAGFAEFDGALAVLRASLDDRDRQERAAAEREQVARLANQIASLTDLLANAVDDDDRFQYQQLLKKAESKLEALDESPAAAPQPAEVPVAATPPAAVTEVPDALAVVPTVVEPPDLPEVVDPPKVGEPRGVPDVTADPPVMPMWPGWPPQVGVGVGESAVEGGAEDPVVVAGPAAPAMREVPAASVAEPVAVAVPARTVWRQPTPQLASQVTGLPRWSEPVVAPVVASPAQVEPAVASDVVIGPWDEGEPPLAVNLVGQGRLTEAYWVTTTSAEPDHRSAVLRFAAASYSSHVQAAFDMDRRLLAEDQDAATVALTAVVRAGLVAGWWPIQPGPLLSAVTLPEPWAALLDASIDAVQRGHRMKVGVGTILAAAGADESRADLGDRAAVLAEELPRRKNVYQRATRVLRRLLETEQPLTVALDTVVAWSRGEADRRALAEVLALFEPNVVQVMIQRADAAVCTPKQAREPIVANARKALVRAIEEVGSIVGDAESMAGRLSFPASADAAGQAALVKAVAAIRDEPAPAGMAGAALALLRRWLLEPTSVAEQVVGFLGVASPSGRAAMEPSADVLLPLYDLPRTPDGRPDGDDPLLTTVFGRLTELPDLGAALRAYCERGDLRRARRLVELQRAGYWSAAADTTVDDAEAAVDRAVDSWMARYRRLHSDANDLFARIRSQNLLDPEAQSTVSGRLQALTHPVDDAFDVGLAELSALVGELEGRESARRAALHGELRSLDIDHGDRERILALLHDDDTVTAAEFMAFVRAGKPLPAQSAQPASDVGTFLDLLAAGFAREPGDQRALRSARAWATLAAGDDALTTTAAGGLDAWDAMANWENRTTGQYGDLPVAVQRVLRTVGLNTPAPPREQQSTRHLRRGYRQFLVRGTPADGSYLAALGSAAPEYLVTVVLEERRGRTVLDVLGPAATGRANVVLYRYPLDAAARRQLVSHTGDAQVHALVVDPAVMGWVAATAPGSWRATQRITLPWTTFNPYTPFVAGLVPPEVFYGREYEMSQVTDPNGGLFVYGGRQLGKSALLRRVEAAFTNGSPESRHAIYLDLKGRGIGEAEPASRIWRELTIELKERGVLANSVSDDAGVDVMVKQVRSWLQGDPDRRILVLADESDAFLTADSRSMQTAGGAAHFPNVLRLKELMESTERHFKVVFAGLHQVQRFGHLSNVPLVHGGPDMEIGPLDPLDARRLVVEPMAALGYRFERPELVWRLLSATNYQASLVQIFCDELVRTLHRRRATAPAFPVPVTEDDVDGVAAGDTVRRLIAERLRITINLDDRYRVLTLIIACRSLEESFGTAYAPDELLDEARVWWPAGFDGLTSSDVSIYLDEMVGLGLLIRLSGQRRYAVRSPNVVNILGTKDDLEAELYQTDFDPPYEYNPRDARRLLFADQQGERRSPLTDGQLLTLTAAGAVSLVSGSAGLGVDRVERAVRSYVEVRGCRVEVAENEPEAVKAVTAVGRHSQRSVIIADLRGAAGADDVVRIWTRLGRHARDNNKTAAVVLADPRLMSEVLKQTGAEPVRLSRWTSDSLRSWPECPFTVPADRRRLIEVTGGWTALVEAAIAKVVFGGAAREDALHDMEEMADDPQWAVKFLARAELADPMTAQVVTLARYLDLGQAASVEDVGAVLELDQRPATALLHELELLDLLDQDRQGIVLDRVVHRCLLAVHGSD